MAGKRRKTIRIGSAEQLRALTSPISIEIIQAVRTLGPSTVAELGPYLGRKAISLHYHVRKLKQVGFLQQTATRRSGARTQAVYDVTADRFDYDKAPKNVRLRRLTNDIVAAMLRLGTRNFASASERPAAIRESGAHRNLLAGRFKARLTRMELAKVNKHLRAVREIFATGNHTRPGELCTLTLLLTPEADEGE